MIQVAETVSGTPGVWGTSESPEKDIDKCMELLSYK